jgi:hypothetical protein
VPALVLHSDDTVHVAHSVTVARVNRSVAAALCVTDGTFDYKSLHGSCPVITGVKFSATKW